MQFNRRNTLKLLMGSGLVLGGATAFSMLGTPVQIAHAEDLSDLMVIAPDEKIMGDRSAPVKIVEYSSMTCPHCAAFHTKTLPGIKEKFIDTGKAQLIFREFPVDPRDLRSIAAFMLARCADDDKYFPMVSVLYSKQLEWARAENPIPILLNIAKLAGFTQESFNACLKNQELMNKVLAIRKKAATDFGVSGTPTFFINGKKHVGNASVEEFSKLIETAM